MSSVAFPRRTSAASMVRHGPWRAPTAVAVTIAIAIAIAAGGCGGSSPQAITVSARRIPAPPLAVRATIPVGVAPTAVAVGAGSVWVANNAAGTLTRLDAVSGRPARTPVRVGVAPVAIAVGAGGVWVAEATGEIVRVDPRLDRVVGRPLHIADPAGVTIGSGSIWVTSRARGTVQRIDPRTGTLAGAPIRVGHQPTDIAVAAGSVWVANSADGTVTRIDARSATVRGAPVRVTTHRPLNPGDGAGPVSQPGTEVLALTAGESGVWVAASEGPQATRIRLVRIDPRQGSLDTRGVRVTGGVPLRLAAGAGAIWVTDVGRFLAPGPPREPALIRVDPRAHAVAGAPTRVGRQPSGLAVGAGSVWVANAGDNTVTRVAVPITR